MRRPALVLLLVAVALALSGLLGFAAHALLIVFGGTVLGTVLRGGSAWVEDRTRLSARWSLVLVLTALLLVFGGLGTWAGAEIAAQARALASEISASLERLREAVADGPAAALVEGMPSDLGELPFDSWAGRLTGGVSWVLGALADTLVLLVLGVFIAFDAGHLAGAVALLVPEQRARHVRDVLASVARALRGWFVGRTLSAAIVGVLTGLGLWALGIPLAAVLGGIAALLSYVPNLGPLLSVVPALLVASAEDGRTVLWVGLLYVVVQLVESNLISPFIQRRMVSLPPAVLLTAQLLFGALWGPLGLLLAAPLALAIVVLVQRLYVEDVLGRETDVLGS